MKSTLFFPHQNPASLQDVMNYLQFVLASFERTPAKNDFERGYERALRTTQTDLLCWRSANAPAPACGPNALVRPTDPHGW
jgi:hypothetical protein